MVSSDFASLRASFARIVCGLDVVSVYECTVLNTVPRGARGGPRATIEVYIQVRNGSIPDSLYTVSSPGYDKLSLQKLIEMCVFSARSKYVCSSLSLSDSKFHFSHELHHDLSDL